MQEAVAKLTGIPLAAVRSAAMLAGSTRAVVGIAVAEGEPGLAEVGLEVGRPVLPMLAAAEPDPAAAWTRIGDDEVAVEWKLDGIRLQAHKRRRPGAAGHPHAGGHHRRLPEVVEVVRALPADRAVIDGEAIAVGPDGRPRPFQETASRTASGSGVAITPYFFDLLHLDGEDLLGRSGGERAARLGRTGPRAPPGPPRGRRRRPRTRPVFDAAVAAGHEGVVVKSLGGAYDAGRRGAGWVKVKPVHTLDLVVLAVEEGSGRRQGWLSNIHLGARDPGRRVRDAGQDLQGHDRRDARVADRALHRADDRRDDWVVHVRPEQVVEIAFDGVQRSPATPAGWRSASRASSATATTRPPPTRTPSTTVRAFL